MKTDKPFKKAFACAGVIFAVILTILVVKGAQNLSYRIGYVIGTCFFPALATGAWGFFSKKSWAWGRFAATVIAFYILFSLITISGTAQRDKPLVSPFAVTQTPSLLPVGTLADAPFRVVVPDDKWKIEDSTLRPMGNNVFLAAIVSNTNALLKSVILKGILKEASDTALDQMCAGINDSFSNNGAKKISESEKTFLGHKAREFAYEVTKGGQTTYNEAIVFVDGKIDWTIFCSGSTDHKTEIHQIFTFYVNR
jgi:hypothetical protein